MRTSEPRHEQYLKLLAARDHSTRMIKRWSIALVVLIVLTITATTFYITLKRFNANVQNSAKTK